MKAYDLPFVMAPAENWRATGGLSDPSRCHGVRVCFSLSATIFRSNSELEDPGPLTVSEAGSMCSRKVVEVEKALCKRTIRKDEAIGRERANLERPEMCVRL